MGLWTSATLNRYIKIGGGMMIRIFMIIRKK